MILRAAARARVVYSDDHLPELPAGGGAGATPSIRPL